MVFSAVRGGSEPAMKVFVTKSVKVLVFSFAKMLVKEFVNIGMLHIFEKSKRIYIQYA